MKHKALFAALAALLCGPAFAAGGMDKADEHSQAGAAAGAEQPMDRETAGAESQGETIPSVGGPAPATEHQAEGLAEYQQRFQELDKNKDELISYDEAQAMPELQAYWKQQGYGEDDTLDQADFAQFESRMQTGVDMYESERAGPGDMPSTPHQRGVTGEDGQVSPDAPSPGESEGGARQ